MRAHRKLKKGGENRRVWTTTTVIAVAVMIAAIFRIFVMSVDPQQYNGILHPWVEQIFFNGAIWIWLNVLALLILYWVEITQESKKAQLKAFLSRFRPILYVMMAFTFVGALFEVLAVTGIKPRIMFTLFGTFVAAFMLVIIILSTFFGLKLRALVGGLYESTKAEQFKIYLGKITRFIIVENIILLALIVLLLIFENTPSIFTDPWCFVGFNLAFRILEFLMILLVLVTITVDKRTPREGDSKSTSPEQKKIESATSAKSDTSKDLEGEMSVTVVGSNTTEQSIAMEGAG